VAAFVIACAAGVAALQVVQLLVDHTLPALASLSD
jgi:hypothetical protein